MPVPNHVTGMLAAPGVEARVPPRTTRLRSLLQHLQAAATDAPAHDNSARLHAEAEATKAMLAKRMAGFRSSKFQEWHAAVSNLEDLFSTDPVAKALPGPMELSGGDQSSVVNVLIGHEFMGRIEGDTFSQWQEFQKKYCDQGGSSNFVLPHVYTGRDVASSIRPRVFVSHPEDCERLARSHVKKAPNFTSSMNDAVIATTDNDWWRKQRAHLVEAFLPNASLSKIMPTSVGRAQACARRLGDLSRGGERCVQINEFFLHEAQAQLQMALFGSSEEYMEATNKPMRDAFAGKRGDTVDLMMGLITEQFGQPHVGPADVAADPSKTIHGPLSRQINTLLDEKSGTAFGNAFIFSFAGHDTTGHTMTWFTFEMAKHPEYQLRVQSEVDALFNDIGERPLEYSDLGRLRFMTRCITETMRLWPAVPNGTYRELQYDDVVKGPHGEDVPLPKGTQIQIISSSRHWDEALWGADVDVFNPDRDFTEEELWHDQPFAGYNPSSKRFSPFTFPPRDCIGKNFAQMESRAILAYLFRSYTFQLAEPTLSSHKALGKRMGVNRGTMGPRDVSSGATVEMPDGSSIVASDLGLYVDATPRDVKGPHTVGNFH